MSNTKLGFKVTVTYHLDNMIMSDDLEQEYDNNLEDALSFIIGGDTISNYAINGGDIRNITTYVDNN